MVKIIFNTRTALGAIKSFNENKKPLFQPTHKSVFSSAFYEMLSFSFLPQSRNMSYNKKPWGKKNRETEFNKCKLLQLPTKKFQRCTEDFECENCDNEVIGNGYTNHCPRCLFSKHVDINPGDRAEGCKGMMEPTGFFFKKGKCVIIHQCKSCGVVRNNKAARDDNFKIFNEESTKALPSEKTIPNHLKEKNGQSPEVILPKDSRHQHSLKIFDEQPSEPVPLLKSSDFYDNESE